MKSSQELSAHLSPEIAKRPLKQSGKLNSFTLDSMVVFFFSSAGGYRLCGPDNH